MYELKIKNHILRIIQDDITNEKTDAIVNAANSSLILGAGVAGAIRQKGGPKIQEECNKIGFTPTGKAAITTGGMLHAPFVIHAVGPVWGEQSDAQSQKLLASAIDASMQILLQRKLHSITFPALSTGIFGFPKQLAASVFKKTLTQFLENAPDPLLVQICLYSAADYEIFQREFKK